jgi:hypothetical protein
LSEIQSPPILKMIRQYLPTLPGVRQDRLPTKALWRSLEKAVDIRNKVVHAGLGPLPSWANDDDWPTPGDILYATSDLLWLFDMYRGHWWAERHLSDSTLVEFGVLSPPAPGWRARGA